MQNGWVVPDVIQADTDKYREDVLGWFLRERVEVTKDGADSLYSMHCKRQRPNGATRAGVPNFGPKQIHGTTAEVSAPRRGRPNRSTYRSLVDDHSDSLVAMPDWPSMDPPPHHRVV
jgi:hypothetical protein